MLAEVGRVSAAAPIRSLKMRLIRRMCGQVLSLGRMPKQYGDLLPNRCVLVLHEMEFPPVRLRLTPIAPRWERCRSSRRGFNPHFSAGFVARVAMGWACKACDRRPAEALFDKLYLNKVCISLCRGLGPRRSFERDGRNKRLPCEGPGRYKR